MSFLCLMLWGAVGVSSLPHGTAAPRFHTTSEAPWRARQGCKIPAPMAPSRCCIGWSPLHRCQWQTWHPVSFPVPGRAKGWDCAPEIETYSHNWCFYMFLMFETWHHWISPPRRWLWIDRPPAHHLCRLSGLAHPIGQAKVGSTTVWHAFGCICWARHRRIEKERDRESSRERERESAREKETRAHTHTHTFIDLTHTHTHIPGPTRQSHKWHKYNTHTTCKGFAHPHAESRLHKMTPISSGTCIRSQGTTSTSCHLLDLRTQLILDSLMAQGVAKTLTGTACPKPSRSCWATNESNSTKSQKYQYLTAGGPHTSILLGVLYGCWSASMMLLLLPTIIIIVK